MRPSIADPAVRDFDDPHLVVVNRRASDHATLAIFLPSMGGRPENVLCLLSVIASQGYRAIGLEYNDTSAVVRVCVRDPDPQCAGEFRRERIFGDVEYAPVSNSLKESIVHRLVMLLRHLDRVDPGGDWRQYLAGDEPAWPKIVVSGLSQGAGMAASKRRPVARVVLFSSPWDFYVLQWQWRYGSASELN